jgi:cysteine desulfurase/selenocysteine lyase
MTKFSAEQVLKDFPIFAQKMHEKRLAYLDSAASAQKALPVLEAMDVCHKEYYANIHRGLYALSQETTERYEAVRDKVAAFIGAADQREVIFTKGATESINLIMHGWGRKFLSKGDVIILSELEHHANIVPWQILSEEKGCIIKVVPICEDGSLDQEVFAKLLDEKVKLIALTHMSNALGVLPPVKEMIAKARSDAPNAKIVIDGSQGVVHLDVNVQHLDCDFYVFTGHKLYGPTGVGVCWGRYKLLEQMQPYQTGGDMINRVSLKGTTFKGPPGRFEAGTPPIVSVIGLGAAIDYVKKFNRHAVEAYEADLLTYAEKRLGEFKHIHIYGKDAKRAGVVSFLHGQIHPHDMATIFDQCGVAVRAGHHCAQPLMDKLDVPSTIRASIGIYNVKEDIDQMIEAIIEAEKFFGVGN